jgi:hypothetical protein
VFQEHGMQVAIVMGDDRVHLKPIIVSKLMDSIVEVAEGISTSDRVINNPSAALLEGDTVRVVTPASGYDLVNAPAAPDASEPAQVSQPPHALPVPPTSQAPQPAQSPDPQAPPAPLRKPPQALQPIQP